DLGAVVLPCRGPATQDCLWPDGLSGRAQNSRHRASGPKTGAQTGCALVSPPDRLATARPKVALPPHKHPAGLMACRSVRGGSRTGVKCQVRVRSAPGGTLL